MSYGGDVDINGELKIGASGYFKVGGNWEANTAGATLTVAEGGTVDLYGSGTFADTTGTRTHWNLKVAASGKTTGVQSAFPQIYGVLTLDGGSLTRSGSYGQRFGLRGSGTVVSGTWALWEVDISFWVSCCRNAGP